MPKIEYAVTVGDLQVGANPLRPIGRLTGSNQIDEERAASTKTHQRVRLVKNGPFLGCTLIPLRISGDATEAFVYLTLSRCCNRVPGWRGIIPVIVPEATATIATNREGIVYGS